MNTKDFVKNIESYYGKYRSGARSVVTQYLEEMDYREDTLRQIWRELILTVSAQYSFVPDVAILETVAKAVWEDRKPMPKMHVAALPDPTARSMKIEVGEMLDRVLRKVRMRREKA